MNAEQLLAQLAAALRDMVNNVHDYRYRDEAYANTEKALDAYDEYMSAKAGVPKPATAHADKCISQMNSTLARESDCDCGCPDSRHGGRAEGEAIGRARAIAEIVCWLDNDACIQGIDMQEASNAAALIASGLHAKTDVPKPVEQALGCNLRNLYGQIKLGCDCGAESGDKK